MYKTVVEGSLHQRQDMRCFCDMIRAYRVPVGKHEGRRPLRRPRRRWEDNIKMDLRVVGLGHGLDVAGSG